MVRSSTTGHALLGLLALRPSWTATELADQISRNMRFFWPRAASRVFAESKAAVDRGWALSRSESRAGQGAPRRTRYRISAAGRQELKLWLASPPRGTVLECEALLRVLLADLGTVDDLRRAIESVGDDADELFSVASMVGSEYLEGTAPFQDDVHVRALVFDYLAGFATFTHDWSERSRAYVDSWSGMDPEARAEAGVGLVRRSMAKFPRQREHH